MKKLSFLILSMLLALSIVNVSCTVTGKETIVDNAYAEDENIRGHDSNTSLASALRKNTSLEIMGVEPNIDIIIRGMNTFVGDPRPLYVVDGIQMGRNYRLAANAVNIRRVKDIRVIKSLSQLSLYGGAGKNGVILINHYKKDKKN